MKFLLDGKIVEADRIYFQDGTFMTMDECKKKGKGAFNRFIKQSGKDLVQGFRNELKRIKKIR